MWPRSSRSLQVLAGICLFLGLEAQAAPVEIKCYATDQEWTVLRETARWRVKTGPTSFAPPRGCAVVAIEVDGEGVVQRAEVVRKRGGSAYMWRALAKDHTYVARGVGWKGLVAFEFVLE